MMPDSLTLLLALACWGLALRSWANHTDQKETIR